MCPSNKIVYCRLGLFSYIQIGRFLTNVAGAKRLSLNQFSTTYSNKNTKVLAHLHAPGYSNLKLQPPHIVDCIFTIPGWLRAQDSLLHPMDKVYSEDDIWRMLSFSIFTVKLRGATVERLPSTGDLRNFNLLHAFDSLWVFSLCVPISREKNI